MAHAGSSALPRSSLALVARDKAGAIAFKRGLVDNGNQFEAECVQRTDFEAARRVFLSKRTEADFQEWRDNRDWTAEKYRRFDRGERMPHDWRLVPDRGWKRSLRRPDPAAARGSVHGLAKPFTESCHLKSTVTLFIV
jgi:hypothetical protein